MEKPRLSEPGKQARRYDNDWLTVLAMLTIFFFHCARFFNYEDWHVKNNQLDESLTLFVAVVAQWIMPLFFILSGISSYYSLRSRTSGRYIRNRFQRLVIPLIFGTSSCSFRSKYGLNVLVTLNLMGLSLSSIPIILKDSMPLGGILPGWVFICGILKFFLFVPC